MGHENSVRDIFPRMDLWITTDPLEFIREPMEISVNFLTINFFSDPQGEMVKQKRYSDRDLNWEILDLQLTQTFLNV